jgi:hypothetical protein
MRIGTNGISKTALSGARRRPPVNFLRPVNWRKRRIWVVRVPLSRSPHAKTPLSRRGDQTEFLQNVWDTSARPPLINCQLKFVWKRGGSPEMGLYNFFSAAFEMRKNLKSATSTFFGSSGPRCGISTTALRTRVYGFVVLWQLERSSRISSVKMSAASGALILATTLLISSRVVRSVPQTSHAFRSLESPGTRLDECQ